MEPLVSHGWIFCVRLFSTRDRLRGWRGWRLPRHAKVELASEHYFEHLKEAEDLCTPFPAPPPPFACESATKKRVRIFWVQSPTSGAAQHPNSICPDESFPCGGLASSVLALKPRT